jgi:hypothetical protein
MGGELLVGIDQKLVDLEFDEVTISKTTTLLNFRKNLGKKEHPHQLRT